VSPSKSNQVVEPELPWQIGPTELISFALERMYKGTDFDRRLAFLILDVGVETLLRTFLLLPHRVTDVRMPRQTLKNAASGNFHEMAKIVWEAASDRLRQADLYNLEFFHGVRNALYHQGNYVLAVGVEQLRGYSNLAVRLLEVLLKVNLSQQVSTNIKKGVRSLTKEPDKVELNIRDGNYRVERLADHTIIVTSLDSGVQVMAKPILRRIIEEKNLDIAMLNGAGNKKNTRQLGREILQKLIPQK